MNEQNWSIRPARLEDVGALTELSEELGYTVHPQTLKARLKRMLDDLETQVLVAELPGGEVVGWVHVYLVCTVESELYAEIGGLVMARVQRRRGIGRALMRTAEAWVQSCGVKVVRLRSNILRAEAHRFYESIGYHQIKTQLTFHKDLEGDSENRQ